MFTAQDTGSAEADPGAEDSLATAIQLAEEDPTLANRWVTLYC